MTFNIVIERFLSSYNRIIWLRISYEMNVAETLIFSRRLPSDTNLGTLAKMHGYACQDLGKILPRSYQGYHDHARSWQG